MFHYLAPILSDIWGPFRLLESYTVLMAFGAGTAAIFTWFFLPRVWNFLPADQGRQNAVDSHKAKNKPTGGGFFIIIFMLPWLFFALPFYPILWEIVGCLALCMLTGYFDDCSVRPWGEVKKGFLDLLIALLTSLVLCQGQTTVLWLPFVKGSFNLPVWGFIPLSTVILWITINATNCSDGVDGLAGILSLLSLFYLAGFMYVVIGNKIVADYLLLPHNSLGAAWAVLLFTGAGALAGYLWYNASPSLILMGDAGSRFLGLFVGIAVMASGNPFLILVVAPVILANGGTGMVKILLLRGLRRMGFDVTPAAGTTTDFSVPTDTTHPSSSARNNMKGHSKKFVDLLHSIRFPLHDHCRNRLGWSDSQVLVRFLLVQTFVTPLLLVILVKLR